MHIDNIYIGAMTFVLHMVEFMKYKHLFLKALLSCTATIRDMRQKIVASLEMKECDFVDLQINPTFSIWYILVQI